MPRWFLLTLSLTFIAAPAFAGPIVIVPGSSDPWLAGMPDGSVASGGDTAPAQSPAQVTGLILIPGMRLTFTSSGEATHCPGCPAVAPEGGILGIGHHLAGAENGISDIFAPALALLGVFLGPSQPNLFPAPGTLSFDTQEARDYLSLAPQLQQVFFIGDGLTSLNQIQEVLVPTGATRLFLGPRDGFEWSNNQGAFVVEVNQAPVPEPASIVLTGMGLAGTVLLLRRRKTAKASEFQVTEK